MTHARREGDRATEAVTDDDARTVIENGPQVVDVGVDVEVSGRRHGPCVPSAVVRDDLTVGSQVFHQPCESAFAIHRTMDQDETMWSTRVTGHVQTGQPSDCGIVGHT